MALSNAGSTVSNAFVTQFADDVIHASQQKTSKLANSIRIVRNVTVLLTSSTLCQKVDI